MQYENSTEEKKSEFAYSLSFPPSLMRSLVAALQDGKECFIEVNSEGEDTSGVPHFLSIYLKTLLIDNKSVQISVRSNPFITEVASVEASLFRKPYLCRVFNDSLCFLVLQFKWDDSSIHRFGSFRTREIRFSLDVISKI